MKKCSLRIYDGSKTLTGTAAQLRHISDRGGWDNFLTEFATEAVTDFAKEATKKYNEKASKPVLKVVK